MLTKNYKKLFSTVLSKTKRIPHKLSEIIIDSKDSYFYRDSFESSDSGNLSRSLDISRLENVDVSISDLHIAEMLLSHKFDLLGSGWVDVGYNMTSLGMSGYRYDSSVKCERKLLLKRACHSRFNRVSKHISSSYKPIDWQRDFKSGYRWSAKDNSHRCRDVIGVKKGVDIKVPWELSRFQHLPFLAIVASFSDIDSDRVITEFKDQVLDFISMNPPRLGVNWVCTMDVAIRAANVLLAYDLFKAIDKNNILDEEFEVVLSKSIHEHGRHIVSHLEWSPDLTSNHYLANISGLLFISSYLESSAEVDGWLAFAIQETIDCINKQFYDDGTNFEASTSYHRLSGEMIVYSVACILGMKSRRLESLLSADYWNGLNVPRLKSLDEQEFSFSWKESSLQIGLPANIIDKLAGMAVFSSCITNHLGFVTQVGDNDNGRFFRLSHQGETMTAVQAEEKYENLNGYCDLLPIDCKSDITFWDENHLDHRSFVSATNGLFNCNIVELDGFDDLEYKIVKNIIGSNCLSLANVNSREMSYETLPSKSLEYTRKYVIELDETVELDNLVSTTFPDFGLHVIKSDNFFFSIFFGSVGQNGNGGHSHNDKLAFDLIVGNKVYFIDPGTYIYTADLEMRDSFRSIEQHNSPKTKVLTYDQNRMLTRFSMSNETRAKIINVKRDRIQLSLEYQDCIILREITIYQNSITILDSSNKPLEERLSKPAYYSSGYGKIQAVDTNSNFLFEV